MGLIGQDCMRVGIPGVPVPHWLLSVTLELLIIFNAQLTFLQICFNITR